jgi:hypothetical protein
MDETARLFYFTLENNEMEIRCEDYAGVVPALS